MYSPLKLNSTVNKESEKQFAKEQKNLKLSILLINKFRNKLKVVTSQEPEVDRLIIMEIQKLLSDGQNNQSALKQLDERLTLEVTKLREQTKNKSSHTSERPPKSTLDPIKARALNKISTPMEEYGKNSLTIDTKLELNSNIGKFASSTNF